MKKGSLQLSINAIVILIMAIAMLGVGIFFINTVLKAQLGDSITFSEDIKEQIRNEIRTSDKKISVYGLSQGDLQLSQNAEEEIFVGVGNKEAGEETFRIQVLKVKDEQEVIDLASQGNDELTSEEVFYNNLEQTIGPGEVIERGVRFFSNDNKGSALYEIVAERCTATSSNSCSTTEPYARKEFFVTVN